MNNITFMTAGFIAGLLLDCIIFVLVYLINWQLSVELSQRCNGVFHGDEGGVCSSCAMKYSR